MATHTAAHLLRAGEVIAEAVATARTVVPVRA
jgi:hypothetical protein